MTDVPLERIPEIKASFASPREYVLRLPTGKDARPLTGVGVRSIHEKTLGKDFGGCSKYWPNYWEHKEGEWKETEFSEAIDARAAYRENPSHSNAADLLMELADILFQRTIVEVRHKGHEHYTRVWSDMNRALDCFTKDLHIRGLSMNEAWTALKVKYGFRTWCLQEGYVSKYKDLEKNLVMEELGWS